MITSDRQRGSILLVFANYAEALAPIFGEVKPFVPEQAHDLLQKSLAGASLA